MLAFVHLTHGSPAKEHAGVRELRPVAIGAGASGFLAREGAAHARFCCWQGLKVADAVFGSCAADFGATTFFTR